VVREQLQRDRIAVFFANLPTCLIGMEECGSAHHWARKLQGFGHCVGLLSPQIVRPHLKSSKSDAADAEAICEAIARPNMRFVQIKTMERQAVLSAHRVRQRFVKARAAQANQIRGSLTEFGLLLPRGITNVMRRVPPPIDGAADLPPSMRQLIARPLENVRALDRQVEEFEAQIKAWHLGSEPTRKLEKIRGMGPLAASALAASNADARSFENRRQVAAWLSLVPKQDSSGSRPTLLGTSKRGDTYLRTLLIHGARSAVVAAQRKGKPKARLPGLLARRHPNIAAMALANKNVHTVRALRAREREFRPDYVPRPATA
jgi:transposase